MWCWIVCNIQHSTSNLQPSELVLDSFSSIIMDMWSYGGLQHWSIGGKRAEDMMVTIPHVSVQDR